VREELGVWFDFAWSSPDDGYVNQRKKGDTKVVDDAAAAWLTPAASPAAEPSKGALDIAGEKILPLR
jgi:D-arabinose 1-dehydrogenase